MTNTINRIIDLAIEIQQIAAPTFHESKRAEFIRDLFESEGLKDVSIDVTGNVYGRWSKDEGRRTNAKPLIVSAHLDTVFPVDMDLSVRREDGKVYGIGIGDNSMGVAALVGLIWMLREISPSSQPSSIGRVGGDIWFVANVGEEGLGDLCGMKAVVKRFGAEVLAYLVVEGLALGHIYHRAVGSQTLSYYGKDTGRTFVVGLWSAVCCVGIVKTGCGIVFAETSKKSADDDECGED